MLIEAGSRRPDGSPDPDEERRRRWEPMRLRSFLSAVGSLTCLSASEVLASPVSYLFFVAAVALLICFVRAEWPGGD